MGQPLFYKKNKDMKIILKEWRFKCFKVFFDALLKILLLVVLFETNRIILIKIVSRSGKNATARSNFSFFGFYILILLNLLRWSTQYHPWQSDFILLHKSRPTTIGNHSITYWSPTYSTNLLVFIIQIRFAWLPSSF